jgi:hypothetical protein
MMTIMLLHFIQRKKEEIKETEGKHSKTRRIQVIKEKTCQRSSASDVTSMDKLREIVLPGREKDNMLPMLTWIHTHLRKLKT